jgi:hypothetical protein
MKKHYGMKEIIKKERQRHKDKNRGKDKNRN